MKRAGKIYSAALYFHTKTYRDPLYCNPERLKVSSSSMLQIQAQPRKPPLRNFNSPLLSCVENANQCSHQIQFSRLGKILLKQARNTCLSCSRYKHEARPPRNSTASRVCGTERAPILDMLSTVAKK